MVAIFLFVFAIITNATVGLIVYLRAPHQISNKKFALLSLVIEVWLITEFLSFIISDPATVLFIQRIHLFISGFIPLLLLEFILDFPKRFLSFPRWVEFLFILVTFLITTTALTPAVLNNIEIHTGFKNAVYGISYFPYIFFILLASAVSALVLIIKLQRSFGGTRLQLQYLLFGFTSLVLISVIGPILVLTFSFTVGRGISEPLATVVFIGFLSFAMERHRFMDINRIAAGVGRYAAVITSLGIVYFVIAYSVGRLFFPEWVNISYILASLVVILAFKYSVSPLRNYFWQVTSKFLYGNLYSRDELFQALSKVVYSSQDLKQLIQKTLHTLAEELMIHKAWYMSFQKKKIIVYTDSGHRSSVAFNLQQMRELQNITHMLFTEDIAEDAMRKAFLRRKIAFLVPLQLKKEKGFLLFGDKLSGAEFSQYDVKTIRLILPTILITLQNAQNIEEIKLFNSRLKKEIRKATKEVRMVNTRLKQADKLKDEFISIASHELKTPTTAIQGFLWLVLQKDRELSVYSRDKIERVAKLTRHMTILVNDMLDVSKIESKHISLHPETLDIQQIVEEVKGEMYPLAMQKQIEIITPQNDSYRIWADKQRVHQIVSNLINNAVKYTPARGKITISMRRTSDKIQVVIGDTGIGIKNEDMSRLFTKFGKLEDKNSPNSTLPGTGLGLYITKNLIELSGGDIRVESKYGKGTKFSFTLPKGE